MVKTFFISPSVVVSRCTEFDHCRWNGKMITSHIADRLMEPDPPDMDRGRDLWT